MRLNIPAAAVTAIMLAVAVSSARLERGTAITAPLAEATDDISMGQPFAEPEKCTNCPRCNIFTSPKHKAPASEGGEFKGLHEDCIEVMPCGHPQCGASALAPGAEPYTEEAYHVLLALVDDVLMGNEAAITEILKTFPEKAHLNVGRQALQIEACTEEGISSHIPLSTKQFAAAMIFAKVSSSKLAD
jgi:hypothetical protein